MADRKKFKDTKLGEWIQKNAPKVGDIVGDVLPDKGVLGIIKNLIDKEDTLNTTQKTEAQMLIMQHEIEIDKIELEKLKSHHNLEGIQLQQEDLWTKRARPTRQYAWLVLILFMIILDFSQFRDTGSIIFFTFENPLLYVIGADFGIYTFNRTREKIAREKMGGKR